MGEIAYMNGISQMHFRSSHYFCQGAFPIYGAMEGVTNRVKFRSDQSFLVASRARYF